MKKILFFILALSLLTQCGIYRKTDARKVPGNVNDRVQKNLEEGKRIRFGGGKGSGSGNFSFATSNEMWRATIEILDFIPLNNADYGGGIIITDWYNEDGSGKDSIKIMVRFLSNEIRADGLKVTVYNKSCVLDSGIQNCSTEIDETGQIGQELKLAILKKAAIYKTKTLEKEKKEFNKKRKPVNRDREGLD
tara:strand:- start:3298 stop:3873 length:576 start_codon:yes stop_codon:yes gene_type:complete